MSSHLGRYIPVQARQDQDTTPFILRGDPETISIEAVFLTDGGRSTDLLFGTLVAKRASSQKWVPFKNEAATNGEAIPAGIFIGPDIAAADLVAGDVTGQAVLLAGADFDANQLVIENAKTLDTVITVGTTSLRTVKDYLLDRSLRPVYTVNASGPEN